MAPSVIFSGMGKVGVVRDDGGVRREGERRGRAMAKVAWDGEGTADSSLAWQGPTVWWKKVEGGVHLVEKKTCGGEHKLEREDKQEVK